jgi:uridine kinase
VSRHRFSDVLRETLTLWGIPHGRENEQILAQIMVAEGAFKAGALSNAVMNRIANDPSDVAILDGVRWLSDEAMIRNFGASGIHDLIIYISADADTRYARMKARNRSGEATTTREQFDKQGQAKNEIDIPQIGSRADIIIQNNYAATADFEKDIERAYTEKIRPLL